MTGLQYFLPTGMLNTNKYIYQNNLNFVSCTPGICEWLFSCQRRSSLTSSLKTENKTEAFNV